MFGQTIEFKMRTFRFTSAGTSSSDPQQQTIDCDLHLEPSANIVQEQAADCTCYTQEQCQGRVKYRILLHMIFISSLELKFSMWSNVSVWTGFKWIKINHQVSP